MLTFKSIEEFDINDPSILTIGVFDGVHLGHQHIFKKMDEISPKHRKVVITFTSPPLNYLLENKESPIIALKQKIDLLNKNSIDAVITLDFATISSLSYLEFLDLLKQHINFEYLVLGEEACFGENQEGNSSKVKDIEESLGFRSFYMPKITKHDMVISTTNIKKLINSNKIDLANEFLGYPLY